MRLISTLLLIEDSAGDARLLREMLVEENADPPQLVLVTSMCEAERHLAQHPADIILLDLGLPDAQGLEAVRRARAAAPRVPLVVLTGLDDETLAGHALQEGAQDYLIKGEIVARGLRRALRYALERKSMEDALFVEKERAQVTLGCIGDGVACTDVLGRITFLNRAAEVMSGWSLQEASGLPMTTVFRILAPVAGYDPTDAALECSMEADRPHVHANGILVRRDGLEIPVEDSIAPIHDREGQAIGAVIILRDVTINRAMTSQIRHSAQHDFLTGLPNRALLNDRIERAIALARRQQKVVGLLFLDLDGFKHINDSLGHPMGDKLLQSVAERLLACVRESDTVSRQGGDEFVVLLATMERPEDGAIIARRILDAVAKPHSIEEHDLHITASIGISVQSAEAQDAVTLVKNADTAMYQAKENGRNGYRFFEREMSVRAVERQSIEEALRRALERNEFSLHYQPKIDLSTGGIIGAEALIRWTHPTRGSVSPAQFIPVAEECGIIQGIGHWVLREACRQARSWLDMGLKVGTMAVNVSAVEFQDEAFLDGLFEVLAASGLEPGALELELTESVLMKRVEKTAMLLQVLRERGVRVAIDDFGTGYSSLSYLRRFPVDALKIDQSFIRQITKAGDDTRLVTAVISMARSLELRVVAEGVETLHALEYLRAHDCDEAQGYYFSRPVPAQQFAEIIRREMSQASPTWRETPLRATG